jgi:hypothetical protein
MNSNGTFENIEEIYKALLEGKTVQNTTFTADAIGVTVKLVNGELGSNTGHHYGFDTPKLWCLYKEPKPKQKFYRRKWILSRAGVLYTNTSWYPSIEEYDAFCDFTNDSHSEEIEEIEI